MTPLNEHEREQKPEDQCKDAMCLCAAILVLVFIFVVFMVGAILHGKLIVIESKIDALNTKTDSFHQEYVDKLLRVRNTLAHEVRERLPEKQVVSEQMSGEYFQEPIPMKDKYYLHYWTCRNGRCKEVFRGSDGQYEVYRCTLMGCALLVGKPKHLWFDKKDRTYGFWAVGKDDDNQFRQHFLGAIYSWWDEYSLHECTENYCRRIAIWRSWFKDFHDWLIGN